MGFLSPVPLTIKLNMVNVLPSGSALRRQSGCYGDCEFGHPPTISPFVHGEPGLAFQLAQFKRPRSSGERQVIVQAAGLATELSFRPNGQSTLQAFAEHLIDASSYWYLAIWHA